MTEQNRWLDVRGIRFPSDRLTIATLRQSHPELFDADVVVNGAVAQPRFFFDADDGGHATDMVASMLYEERLIAALAFASETGRALSVTGIPLDELKDELAGQYLRYGLASGAHQAAELIRDIERQGRELAGMSRQ
jgi:hypothetical protein